MGLERLETEEAEAGDIVAISGVADLSISDTSARSTPRKRCPR
jgi:GTP-binding protein